jgi:hypothetical protein
MKCEFEQLVIWLFSGMMGMILEDSIKACWRVGLIDVALEMSNPQIYDLPTRVKKPRYPWKYHTTFDYVESNVEWPRFIAQICYFFLHTMAKCDDHEGRSLWSSTWEGFNGSSFASQIWSEELARKKSRVRGKNRCINLHAFTATLSLAVPIQRDKVQNWRGL